MAAISHERMGSARRVGSFCAVWPHAAQKFASALAAPHASHPASPMLPTPCPTCGHAPQPSTPTHLCRTAPESRVPCGPARRRNLPALLPRRTPRTRRRTCNPRLPQHADAHRSLVRPRTCAEPRRNRRWHAEIGTQKSAVRFAARPSRFQPPPAPVRGCRGLPGMRADCPRRRRHRRGRVRGVPRPESPPRFQPFASPHAPADFSLLLHRYAAAEGCPACALTAQGVAGIGEAG